MSTSIVIANQEIHTTKNALYSLTDLHKASGAANKNKPNLFMSNKNAGELIAEIEKAGIPAFKKTRGVHGGTYACKELVYAYAMWISPAFHLKVIRTFDEVVQKELKALKQTHPKLTPHLQHQLKSTIDAKLSVFSSEDQKRLYPQVWARVKNKFKVTQYADIREDEIGDVINYLLHMELEMPKKFKGFEVLPQRLYIEDGEVRALTNDDRVVSASEVFDIRCELTNAIGLLQNARDTITKTFELNKLISQAS